MKTLIITGATGLVGGEAIRAAIADKQIKSIIAITRKPLQIKHKKLQIILHNDFENYKGLEPLFKQADACIWALGISQSQVSKEQYDIITYNYAVAAAKAMHKPNKKLTFIFVSGEGARQDGKAKTLFGRVKGKTELALQKMKIPLYIARPAGIKPIHKNPNTSLFNKVVIPLFPILEFLFPTKVIHSDDLGKALVNIAKNGAKETIVDNVALKNMHQ